MMTCKHRAEFWKEGPSAGTGYCTACHEQQTELEARITAALVEAANEADHWADMGGVVGTAGDAVMSTLPKTLGRI